MGRSELLHMKGERVCRGNSVQSLSVSGRAGDSGPHPFSDCRFGLPYYWILTAEEVSLFYSHPTVSLFRHPPYQRCFV